MKCEKVPKNTVMGAEATTVSREITEAIKLKIKDITIEGDNLSVVNVLKGTWKCNWEEDMLISDARLDLRSFRTVDVRHVFRENNRVADRLDFLGHSTTTDYSSTDLELRVLIRKNALGWTTDRL